MKTLLVTALASAAAVYAITGVAANALALETDYLTSEPPTGPAAHASVQKAAVPGPWAKTKATFYGNPYDAKPSRFRCADGTPYRSDGAFCATRLVPIGTVIEVRYTKYSKWSKVAPGVDHRDFVTTTLRLVVRDTQAKRFGHLIDIPSKTWDKFGAKRSIGMLPVQWRVVR